MGEAWERCPGESTKAYKYFCIYRDLGPERTVEAVRKKSKKHPSYRYQLEDWCSRYQWVKRCAEYDDYLEKMLRLKNEEKIKRMHRRHIRQAILFQKKLVERLKHLDPGDLTPSDIAKWFDIAVKIERLSMGESTENQELSGNEKKPIGVKMETEGSLNELLDKYERIIDRIQKSTEGAIQPDCSQE